MAYGVGEIDVFQTVDLWEKKDISQVTTTIFALGRTVSAFKKNKLFILNERNIYFPFYIDL